MLHEKHGTAKGKQSMDWMDEYHTVLTGVRSATMLHSSVHCVKVAF